jgi:hypothetical protein
MKSSMHTKRTRWTGAVGIVIDLLAPVELASAQALDPQLSLAQGADAPAPPPPDQPLMAALGAIGLGKPLKDLNINIYGWVEAGFTLDCNSAPDNLLFGRVFDFQSNQLMLNQLDLNIERIVDLKKFDIGFKVEMMYGQDAGLIHSNGMTFGYSQTRSEGDPKNSPENQFDLTQAYLQVAIPVGNGVDLKLGKFAAPFGYETINPLTRPFYSCSYLFGFAVPFTQTGVLANYSINEQWAIGAGITRGWEQSLDDNNNSIDGLGQVKYTGEKLGVVFTFSVGPEQPDNSRDWRTLLDLIVTCKLSDELTLGLNADYGWEDIPGSGDASWYGVAGYASYVLNDRFTLNGRVEWFDDADGTRTGVAADYYEVTVGVTIKPFPDDRLGQNLLVRPEVRLDYSDEDVFGGGTDDTLVTFGMDAIFSF